MTGERTMIRLGLPDGSMGVSSSTAGSPIRRGCQARSMSKRGSTPTHESDALGAGSDPPVVLSVGSRLDSPASLGLPIGADGTAAAGPAPHCGRPAIGILRTQKRGSGEHGYGVSRPTARV